MMGYRDTMGHSEPSTTAWGVLIFQLLLEQVIIRRFLAFDIHLTVSELRFVTGGTCATDINQ